MDFQVNDQVQAPRLATKLRPLLFMPLSFRMHKLAMKKVCFFSINETVNFLIHVLCFRYELLPTLT